MKQGRLEEPEAKKYFTQLVMAIRYCHSRQIVHRDIKKKNILFDHHGNIKVIDFGMSNYTQKEGKLSTFCGTPCYAAPEMVIHLYPLSI
jgi:serine/threonine protein kinase